MLQRINDALDHVLGKAWVYMLLAFLPLWADRVRQGVVLPIIVYAVSAVVFVMYALRWIGGRICRVNPVLVCVAALFGWMQVVTWLFNGYSGYRMVWCAAFALMLMLDMGLQRERASVLSGIGAALSVWVLANLVTVIAFPGGMNVHEMGKKGFVPEWLLGNRVFYYRIVFAALGVELMRAQALHNRFTKRTYVVTALCLLNIALQRGGTGLLGAALMIAMIVFFARRALPRYATPLIMLGAAVLIFVGIHVFEVQRLFAWLIQDILGKDLTLTKRTVIWEAALPLIGKNPLTGVGYLPVAYIKPMLAGYSHTHNQVLELLLHGGAVALAIYAGAVYFASREALMYRRSAAVKHAAILLMVFVFMGVAEMFHNDPFYYAMFILLSRSEQLAQGAHLQPRISAVKRLQRDLKKK